jgi:hypothetical protein
MDGEPVTVTYNPILEVRVLPRFRFSVRDIRPKMNTALVLVPDTGEPLVVRSGQPVPQVRTANYRELYSIDVSDHLLELKCKLPSSDSAFVFNALVTYRCRVSDPAVVVQNSYTNVGAVLSPLLSRVLRNTTRNFDPDQAGQAEELANRDLQKLHSRLGFSITDCVVELALDSDEADYKRKLRNVHHTVEVESAELAHVMPYVEAGDVGMLALYIAKHRDQAAAVVELLMVRDHERGEQLIEAMKVVFAKGGPDEDFDIERARTRIVSRVADEISGERSGTPMLSLSRGSGRLRGTMLGIAEHDRVSGEAPRGAAPLGEPGGPRAAGTSDDHRGDGAGPPDPDAGA